jgi:hypothetical protein
MTDHDHEENEIEPRKGAPAAIIVVSQVHALVYLSEQEILSGVGVTHLKPVIRPQDIEKNMSGT